MNKRIISGVAALALVFSSAVPAFAAENEEFDTFGNFTVEGGNDSVDFGNFDDDDDFADGSNNVGDYNVGFTVGMGDSTVPIYDEAPAEETPTVVIPGDNGNADIAPAADVPAADAPADDVPAADVPKPGYVPKTTNNTYNYNVNNYWGFGGNFTTYGAYKPYTPTFDKENADKILVNYGDGITEVVTPGSDEADAIFGAKEDWDSPNKDVKFVSTSPFTPWVKVPVTVPKDGDKPDYVSYGYYNNPVTDENGRIVPTFNWGFGWFGNYFLNNMPVVTYGATNYNNWFAGPVNHGKVEYYTPSNADEIKPVFAPHWFAPKKYWAVPTANWFAPHNHWFGFTGANWFTPKKVKPVAPFSVVKKTKKVKKPVPVVKVVEKAVYVPVYTNVTNWYSTNFKPVIVTKKKFPAPMFNFGFGFNKGFKTSLTKLYKGFIPAPHL